jgi:hypothetical protein
MADSRGITRTWTEWVMEDGALKAELVIETNLETRIDAKAFDETAFTRMVDFAVRANATGHFERVRVVPVGSR